MPADRTEYFKTYRLQNRDANVLYQRLWKERNPEKVREYQHRHYVRHTEKRRNKSRKYYVENIEKAKAASAKWRLNNLDRINKTHAKWKAQNRERFLAKKKAIRLAIYGLTQDSFNEILASQGGVCAVCGNPSPNKRRLHVDHDHKSGKVRSLLCTRCNCAIGLAKENPKILRALAEYLELHSGNSLCSVCS